MAKVLSKYFRIFSEIYVLNGYFWSIWLFSIVNRPLCQHRCSVDFFRNDVTPTLTDVRAVKIIRIFPTGEGMQLMSHSMHRWIGRITGLTTYFSRVVFTVTRVLHDSCFMLHAGGKLRRFLLVHFQKQYVHRQLAAREGTCSECGTCCNLLLTCPMLTKPGLCLVYGKCRPQACKAFPIDQRDIDEVKLRGGSCGFHFFKEILENPEKL